MAASGQRAGVYNLGHARPSVGEGRAMAEGQTGGQLSLVPGDEAQARSREECLVAQAEE